MFNWASDAILITSLTKDADEEDQLTANNSRSRPTKFFANFLLRVKTQKEVTLAKDSRNRAPKHITIGKLLSDSHPVLDRKIFNLYFVYLTKIIGAYRWFTSVHLHRAEQHVAHLDPQRLHPRPDERGG